MKVFASSYLENFSSDKVEDGKKWSWTPEGGEATQIHACGANTSSNESTYAAEKDSRTDNDRPNEGMFIA